MRLISFCKILLLSGCFTTVCTSMNAQDKVMKKQDSPIDIDLWQNGLPNTNGIEKPRDMMIKRIISNLVSEYICRKLLNSRRELLLYVREVDTGIWQWLTRGMTGHRFSMNRE